ncbi:Rieske (2Fe-2S) protein [Streptomyces platensis]|uniref:3-phenylpropionate/cinnamic acid dioxygenase ferredoxin subunit n=1 Tax=Streptomyces platensis TaxID=58346 RepID=A0AAE6NFG7_STRPT|nr:Rieske (2Fe-2S) protein [Streptomyces platensis]OSY46429.1 3-phenylpropionate/cinnamic acid dioxygenase ferredoxin subunit [Streptomyces platensis]QEV51191.1 Rieske (2Fe-2S) protein [Streptomyces platensis]
MSSALVKSLDAPGRWEQLDTVIGPVQRVVRGLPLGRFRDVLHGLPIGHPLHPALVQLPMGAWMSAAVLDTVPGTRRGARLLVGVGVLAAVPAAWAGWVDWAEQHEDQMRTGLVHAGSMALAIGLYARSWVHRGRGSTARGKLLGFAGLSAAGAGGLLGGHLAFRQAAGPNKAEPVPHLLEEGWHPVGSVADFPVGEAVRRELGEVPLLVVRQTGGEIHVLAGRCSHLSGPLTDGTLADGCVTCPWHGSVFRLSDGANVGGPATAPQPSFRVSVEGDGTVYVQLPGAG